MCSLGPETPRTLAPQSHGHKLEMGGLSPEPEPRLVLQDQVSFPWAPSDPQPGPPPGTGSSTRVPSRPPPGRAP